MNRLIKSLATCFGIVALLSGCSKDKGNYNYKDLNEFTIEDVSDTYSIAQGDTLIITPKIVETKPDADRFRYSWVIETYAESSGLHRDTLGTGSSIKKVPGLGPGTYDLKYEIKDKNTRIVAAKNIKLAVRAAYQIGWTVLSATESGGDISMIVDQDKKIFHNIFSRANEGRYIPLPLSGLFVPSSAGKDKPVFVTANGYNKVLDPYSFKERNDIKDQFFVPSKTEQSMSYLASVGTSDFPSQYFPPAVINGKYTYSGATYALESIRFNEPTPGDYELTPYMDIIWTTGIIGYDKKNGRFVYFSYGNPTMHTVFGSGPFDPLNIKQEMIYGMTLPTDRYTALFKSGQNDYHLYQIGVVSKTLAPVSYVMIPAASLPNIDRAKAFTGSKRTQVLYYAAENQVYMLEVTKQAARSIFSFAVGENIKTIEYRDKEMIISTWNGIEGKVYFFTIDNFETFSSPAKEVYTGFGEIKAVKRKFG